MRKIIAMVMACCSLCWSISIAYAANIKDYPTVAVMNFGNKAVMSRGLRDTDFSAATEYAIYQLSACGWFDLVDYEQLSAMAKMQRVQMSGLIDSATAVQVGRVLGAQFMVVGNLTGLTTKESGLSYQHGNRGGIGGQMHTVTANVAMRIVDIETGRIVVAGLGKGESASTNMEVVFKKYRRPKRNINAYPQMMPSGSQPLVYHSSAKYRESRLSTGNIIGNVERDIEGVHTGKFVYLGNDMDASENFGYGDGTDSAYGEVPVVPVQDGSPSGEAAYPDNDSLDDGIVNEGNVYTGDVGDGVDSTGTVGNIYGGSEDIYGMDGSGNYDYGNEGIYGQTNDSYYDVEEYKIQIGTAVVSDIQVRNAISKAVRDCIYGNMGLMTTLNGGKKLNIKTGF